MAYFNQEELLNNLRIQIDTLKGLVRTAVLSAIIFWWAGISRRDPIEILSISIPINIAFFFAAALYAYIIISTYLCMVGIKKIISLIDDVHYIQGISIITLAPFFANPYLNFNRHFYSKIYSLKGINFLIILYWVCLPSLISLIPEYYFSKDNFWIFRLLMGVMSLIAMKISTSVIGDTYYDILLRLRDIDADFQKEFYETNNENTYHRDVIIGISVIIMAGTYLWRLYF